MSNLELFCNDKELDIHILIFSLLFNVLKAKFNIKHSTLNSKR